MKCSGPRSLVQNQALAGYKNSTHYIQLRETQHLYNAKDENGQILLNRIHVCKLNLDGSFQLTLPGYELSSLRSQLTDRHRHNIYTNICMSTV